MAPRVPARWRRRVLALVVALGTPAAQAAVFTVTNTNDAGPGSLRQAVEDANASADPTNTIDFSALGPSQTITLLSALPEVDQGVTIDASTLTDLTLEGPGMGTELVTLGADTTLADLAVREGFVLIGDGDALTFTTSDPLEVEVSADLRDATLASEGEVVKDGPGTLILTGTNDYSGGTTVLAGTLVGDAASLQGSITNDAALVFEQTGAPGTFVGEIGGTGSVEKTGDQDLVLQGENAYTGGTLVSQGRLVGDTASLQGDITVEAGTELVFEQTAAGSYEGVIDGAGAVVKDDPGEVAFTGANDYAGGTTVLGGTLVGTAASIPGDVAVDTPATLAFDQAEAGTFGGVISGMGDLEKRGAGSLSLTGANTYEGGTTVTEGTLVVIAASLPTAGDVDVQTGARLAFQQDADDAFSDTTGGGGSLEKRGGAVLTLDGTHTYAEGAFVTGGVLDLVGTLDADTTVAGGGTLGGTGTVAGPVVVNGTVAPGSGGTGALSVASVAFAPGSALEIEVDGASQDLLSVAGAADLAGATLVLQVAPGTGDRTGVKIVEAGSITTPLAIPDFAFLDVVNTDAGGDTVTLDITDNGLGIGDVGDTPNQRAVANALAALEAGAPSPDVQELLDHFDVVTAAALGPALDSVGGEPIGSLTTARFALSEQMGRALHRHMRAVRFPPLGTPSRGEAARADGAGTPAVAAPPAGRGAGVWIEGAGVLGALEGDGNGEDVDYDLLGATLGADLALGERGLLGIAAGYARAATDLSEPSGEARADMAQVALYGAYATPRAYAGLSARYAYGSADSERDIAVGELVRRADGDFDTHDYGVRGEVAVHAAELAGVAFEPLGAFSWSHYTRESFRETGAGDLGLDVDDESLDSLLLEAGARLRTTFEIDPEALLVPELRALWLHEFGDRERRVESTLDGTALVVEGAEAPADAVLVGAGWAVQILDDAEVSLDYDARIDADRLEHTGRLTVRLRF